MPQSSKRFRSDHPTVLNVDNGRPYQMQLELDLRKVFDQLKLKTIESQCLADLGRKMLADIRNKNATIALLQKRLDQAQAMHYSRRAA